MRNMNVFATQEEIDSLKASLNTPYIVAGGIEPMSPLELSHSFALKHGLPEFEGMYGIDLRTGEFVAPC